MLLLRFAYPVSFKLAPYATRESEQWLDLPEIIGRNGCVATLSGHNFLSRTSTFYMYLILSTFIVYLQSHSFLPVRL